MTAKTRAIPSLHRDGFLAKVPGPCPVLSSGNMPPLQAGAFAKIACKAIFIRSALFIAGPLAAILYEHYLLPQPF
jgi:hypothetical protein